jgi:regulator of RNase E activity RraA
VVGDADSVVVVPLEHAETVLEALAAIRAAEVKAEQRVRDGATMVAAMEPIIAAARIVGG